MTITSSVMAATTATAPSNGRVPRVLRLTGVAEETHHWYEESAVGRHLPQVIGAAGDGRTGLDAAGAGPDVPVRRVG